MESRWRDGRALGHMETKGETRGERGMQKEVGGWLGECDASGVKEREDLKECLLPRTLSPFLPTNPPNLLAPTQEGPGAEHKHWGLDLLLFSHMALSSPVEGMWCHDQI